MEAKMNVQQILEFVDEIKIIHRDIVTACDELDVWEYDEANNNDLYNECQDLKDAIEDFRNDLYDLMENKE